MGLPAHLSPHTPLSYGGPRRVWGWQRISRALLGQVGADTDGQGQPLLSKVALQRNTPTPPQCLKQRERKQSDYGVLAGPAIWSQGSIFQGIGFPPQSVQDLQKGSGCCWLDHSTQPTHHPVTIMLWVSRPLLLQCPSALSGHLWELLMTPLTPDFPCPAGA